MPCRILYLWISSALVRSLKEVLLIISPSQLTLYYSEWVSSGSILLSADIKSVLLWHHQRIYTTEVQKCLSPGFIIQSICKNFPQLLIS